MPDSKMTPERVVERLRRDAADHWKEAEIGLRNKRHVSAISKSERAAREYEAMAETVRTLEAENAARKGREEGYQGVITTLEAERDRLRSGLDRLSKAVVALGDRDPDNIVYFEAKPVTRGAIERWSELDAAQKQARAALNPSGVEGEAG